MCLNCHKNRCNTVGYDTRAVRKPRNVQMYTMTRSSMPFRVYHYQLKVHFPVKGGRKPRAQTKGEISFKQDPLFSAGTEKDIGDLLMLKFKWEETNGWSASNMLKMVSSWWSGDYEGNSMGVHRIRIRAGETQQKLVFCLKNPEAHNLNQELTFVKCKDAWRRASKRVNLDSLALQR
ncbi:hypothetical protein WMY93_025315 [Mugilogobius chulae]|uniref:PLAT domain-containing protein n=1 Tax=Mugilogobius chulae TaxID=88201 RepID=A0AAW0N717_9GOBI